MLMHPGSRLVRHSLLALTPALLTAGLVAQKVDFAKEIAPILTRCAECHGADEPEADLRLDIKAGLFPEDKDDWKLVPGKPDDKKNEFFYRITLPADDEDIMPPEGDPLTKQQIAVVRRWIEQGAHWPDDGDAAIAALLKARKPKVEKLDLPALTADQKAAEDKAIAAIEQAGGLAMRVAANTHATEVNLSLMGAKATGELVARAGELSGSLIRLNLGRTKVDDAAVQAVAGMKQLRWLSLANTAITDAALQHLSGLSELRYLNLYGTGVTDAGLRHLQGLKNLRKLYLWQTKATRQGAKALQTALPAVKIDMGEYAAVLAKIKPKAAAAPAAALVAINKECPVSGKPVVAGKVSVYQGQVIGLCCDKCKAKFDKDPTRCIDKVAEFKKATGPVANAKCPVSGKPVDPEHTAGFRGKVIGLCCAKCKAKFEKAPESFLGKLTDVFPPAAKAPAPVEPAAKENPAPAKKQPGAGRKRGGGKRQAAPAAIANQQCPVSGKPVDPAQTSVFRRKRIGFCCENCKAKFDANPRRYLAKLSDVFPNAGRRRDRKQD